MNPVQACLPLLLALGASLLPSPALAQFDSGSDGSDGALVVPPDQGLTLFEPRVLGIDGDGDHVFHFTTITIGANSTLLLRDDTVGLGGGDPVIWLAQGEVIIEGEVNLDGDRGHQDAEPPGQAVAGAGGFAGGRGGTAFSPQTSGSGPGGGGTRRDWGSGGGHHLDGDGPNGGRAYGNPFLRPLIGGSGGSGGGFRAGAIACGGGGGGGALLIASSDRIEINGLLSARGGSGGAIQGGPVNNYDGGGGSGGALRLVAPSVEGSGTLNVRQQRLAGTNGYAGSDGRIRIEGTRVARTLLYEPPGVANQGHPGDVFLPANAPAVRVTAIGGVAVPPDPTGSFVVPDVVINAAAPVQLELAASNIPLGTVIHISVDPEGGAAVALDSSPLAGAIEASTATAGPIVFQPNFTRVFVSASWNP